MSAPACATSRGDRLVFALLAGIMGLLAATMIGEGNLLCGIPAAICTTFLVIGALTGWCPTQLLHMRRSRRAPTSTLNIPEVSGVISVDPRDR